MTVSRRLGRDPYAIKTSLLRPIVRGTDAYNLALGTRRAEAVRDYLVAQGVASSRIELETRGESQPIASGTSEGAMAQNRRDAFIILVASE